MSTINVAELQKAVLFKPHTSYEGFLEDTLYNHPTFTRNSLIAFLEAHKQMIYQELIDSVPK